LKTAFLIVTLASLMAGCASEAPQSEALAAEPAKVLVAGPASLSEAPALAAPAIPDPLPDGDLSAELLFKLLGAEIAFQRGQWQTAYVTTLSAARQTRDPRLARRAAEIAITAKQNNEALSAIRLWRELAPQSVEAAEFMLGLIILNDDLAGAEPLLAERLAATAGPVRAQAMLQTERMLHRVRDRAAAFALLERLMAPYEKTADAHIALAQGALHGKDLPRAEAEARTALRLKPDSELAVLTLTQALPDNAAAAAALEKFIAAHPGAREVRMAHARLQIDRKDYARARAEFEALLKQTPDDLASLYALGVLGSQADDAKSAEKYLTRYVQVLAEHPDDDRDPNQALLLLAQIAEDRQDLPAALNWLSEVEPGDAWLGAQVHRAQLMAKQDKLDDGLKLLHDLKSDNPREQVLLSIAEAQLLRAARRTPEAMAVMQEAMTRFPADPDLLYDMAMMAEKDGQFELMETTLRKLIVVAPKNQHAYNALGYSLAERNVRLPEALKLVETALALTPDDPFILDSLGWVQYRLGMLQEAETSLRRAYSMRADPEIAVHLGEVLWVSGRKNDAQKLWRDANIKDPQNDALKNTLARLRAEL
jgi:Flp pilus assembly protein TadD